VLFTFAILPGAFCYSEASGSQPSLPSFREKSRINSPKQNSDQLPPPQMMFDGPPYKKQSAKQYLRPNLKNGWRLRSKANHQFAAGNLPTSERFCYRRNQGS
jgi:hypothetical protein